jgi:DNA-binding transcriptional ArsR family regulator
MAQAMSHPIRARALPIFRGRCASAKEISEALGLPLGLVSYHVDVLWDLDCIELVKEEKRRGATEYFYRGISRTYLRDEIWAKLGADARNEISVEAMEKINGAAVASFEAGVFDIRDNRHVSFTPVRLDEEGWNESMNLLNEMLDRFIEIGGESANRIAERGAEGIDASISMIGIESAPSKPQPNS